MTVTSKLPLNSSITDVIMLSNRLLDGKLNSTDEVTLDASSATTTVTNIRVGPDSVITFMPTTQNAASELSTMFVSNVTRQEFSIGHTNNSQTDRTYRYTVIG